MTSPLVKSQGRHGHPLHPLPLRIMHWTNALAMFIMILSGWKIYNDEVLFGWLHFSYYLVPGPYAQHGLQWHFFGMWILAFNGLCYLAYGLYTGRFRRKLFPISISGLLTTVKQAVTFKLDHEDLTRYNQVQRVLYVGIICVGILVVLTGLSIWKPVQFSELASLFYDFQTARLIHFLCMAAIVLFLLVHVALALLVPKSLVAMVTGGPLVVDDDDAPKDRPAPYVAPAE